MLQIVAMETELKKAGKLNSIQDVKEFWDNMLAPPTQATDHKPSYRPRKYNTTYPGMAQTQPILSITQPILLLIRFLSDT